MRREMYLAIAGVLPLAAFAAGCGGDQTTASKSAAAFDDALRKGAAPTSGGAHGHHGAAEATKRESAAGHETAPEHSGHGGDGSSAQDPGMRHEPTAEGVTSRPSQRGHAAGVHGTDHSPTTGPARSAAGTDHSTMNHSNTSGMDHSKMEHASVDAAPPVPERPAVASAERLIATLRPDPLDVPEPTALREAAK